LHTEAQLIAAFKWIEELYKTSHSKIAMARMRVKDWPTAYQIFVSTNTTGVRLSLPDIIRAMILSILQGEEEQLLEKATENLNRVSNEIHKNQQTRFIRSHWISRYHKKESATSIGQIYGKKIDASNPLELVQITQDIADDIQHYLTVTNPGSNSEQDSIKRAFLKCKVKQHIPLMMAVERAGYNANSNKLVHSIVESLFITHAQVKNGSPSKYEALFAEAGAKIDEGGQAVVDDITGKAREQLFNPYTKQNFKAAFAKLKKDNVDLFHYIFRKIELKLKHGESPEAVEFQVQYFIKDNQEVNLEHILPQKIGVQNLHGQYWRDEFGENNGENHLQNLWKIGNLTLLDKMANQVVLGNKRFPDKLNLGYRKKTDDDDDHDEEGAGKEWSGLLITNQLEDYDDWNEDNIESRANWLASLSVDIWAEPLGLEEGEAVEAAPEEDVGDNDGVPQGDNPEGAVAEEE
jgi:hypothetical protein